MQRVVSACLVFIVPVLLNMAHAAPDAKLNEVLQTGYAECKSAHVLRRKDLALSKQTYARYLDIKDQLDGLDAGFLKSDDPEVARVVGYCETVGKDIARTEALPIIQQGVDACGAAAELLQGGDLEAARSALANYDELKDRAVEVAPVVLEVYSVMSGVRRCERVAAEIESLFQQQQAMSTKLNKVSGYLDNVLAACEAVEVPAEEIVIAQVEDPDASAASVSDTADILREQLAASEQALIETPGEELLVDESLAESELLATVAETKQSIKACQDELAAAIENADKTVAELQAELAKRAAAAKAAEEAAAAEAEELAVKEESPEEQRRRLEKNAELYTLVKRVAPEFPGRALRAARDGFVLVEYTIGVDGTVIDPVVIDSQGGKSFDKAALKAVKQWEYEPGFAEDAEPEVAVMRARINFALQ